MTLQQLTYFLAAADHGSFSAAADALLLAQPSVSEQVRRLEAELGTALFTRVGRGLVLTEAGRLLQPVAERALAATREAAEVVSQARRLEGGTVAFGTFGGAHHSILLDLIADFRAAHPAVRVRAIGQNSAEVADAVRAGALEAGLVVLPIEADGLDVRPLGAQQVVYVSADPARVTEPMTIERLARAPLILYDARWAALDPIRRQLSERAQAAGVTLQPVIEVEYVTAALDLAARGLGDTVGDRTQLAARPQLALHTAPFDPPLDDRFAFITRRGGHVSPAARAFMELAEARLRRLLAQ